jgi:hypothetical protein
VPLQKIDKAFRTHRSRLFALASKADGVLDAREALELYVDLFSSPDLQSFRRPHSVALSRLDTGVLEELLEALGDATNDLRRTLVADYPGGLSGFRWTHEDNPQVAGLIRLELEPTMAT